MITKLKHFKWFSLVSGILLILAGLFALFNPIDQLVTLGFLLAFAWLVSGISSIISYFTTDNPFRSWVDLVVAALNICFAILLLSGGYMTFALLLPTLIAYWLIVVSIFQLIAAIRLNEGNLLSNAFFWYAILGVVAGFILLYHPLFTGLIVSFIVALAFIQQGIDALTRFFRLNKMV